MSEKKIKIKIEGEGIMFEEQISKMIVPQIINICLLSSENKESADLKTLEVYTKNQPKESVVEYIRRCNANSNPEKILAFAGFTKNIQGKETFFQNEIKSLFREARDNSPANFTRDFNLVISNGWVHNDSDIPNSYYITQTGDKVLESGFSEATLKRKRSSSKKVSKKSS